MLRDMQTRRVHLSAFEVGNIDKHKVVGVVHMGPVNESPTMVQRSCNRDGTRHAGTMGVVSGTLDRMGLGRDQLVVMLDFADFPRGWNHWDWFNRKELSDMATRGLRFWELALPVLLVKTGKGAAIMRAVLAHLSDGKFPEAGSDPRIDQEIFKTLTTTRAFKKVTDLGAGVDGIGKGRIFELVDTQDVSTVVIFTVQSSNFIFWDGDNKFFKMDIARQMDRFIRDPAQGQWPGRRVDHGGERHAGPLRVPQAARSRREGEHVQDRE
jgi:hypothetical protein